MAKKRKLSKRQVAVMDDLFEEGFSEQQVLDRHGVSRNLYNKWLADECFGVEFSGRLASAYRQSQLIIARYAPLAAAKLVQLTESEKEETARKACLDIISLPSQSRSQKSEDGGRKSEDGADIEQLCPETAERLLAAMAEDRSRRSEDRGQR